MKQPFITIGFDRWEMDFEISAAIQNLSLNEMNELRQMIVVAIGTAEDMWRRERDKQIPKGSQEITK